MPRVVLVIWLLVGIAVLQGCSSPRFAAGKRPTVTNDQKKNGVQEGFASYYADEFNGRKTASGEAYDMNAFTAAHRTLPFGTKVKVKNLNNGKIAIVRINDRGPFKDERIIDVSFAAAKQLGMIGSGTVWVQLEILEVSSEPK